MVNEKEAVVAVRFEDGKVKMWKFPNKKSAESFAKEARKRGLEAIIGMKSWKN